jgi:hypothetical protein
MTIPPSLETRLAIIEQQLSALAADVESLRAELSAPRGDPRLPATPPPHGSQQPRAARRIPISAPAFTVMATWRLAQERA